jgi:LacI family transcriptional regulator
MATIYDVAKLAGFSKSTVSKVLTDAQHISPVTKQKVIEAMEALNYRPNYRAVTLASGKNNIIGLIIPREISYVFSTSFFPFAVKGISSVLVKNEISMIMTIHEKIENKKMFLKNILNQNFSDGYILLDVRKNDSIVSELVKMRPRKEFVIIGNCQEYPEVSFVDLDQVKGAQLVVDHFAAYGHRQIAMIAGPVDSQSTLDRIEGFLLGNMKLGIDNPPIIYGDYTIDSGYKAAQELLEKYPLVTAIFAASDLLALGCMKYFHERSIAIPEQISVIGFDNSEMSQHTYPALTTVKLGEYNLGSRAAELLLERMASAQLSEPQRILLEPELVVRQTVAFPRK